MSYWQPTATLAALQRRARLLADIRAFLLDRQVLEVEVPQLSKAGGTDVNIELLKIDGENRWLASSPEFPLKRLVAAGYGDVYALQKVFRRGESGKRHNSEFTMLEWYRVGFDEFQLMSEVEDLCRATIEMPAAMRLSYRDTFRQFADIDPFAISNLELAERGADLSGLSPDDLSRDGWLDVLFSHLVEPKLQSPVFVFDFPASQAALAQIDTRDYGDVARRFELIYQGVELANGYFELTDAQSQLARFEADITLRTQRQQPVTTIDQHLLSALQSGMPSCSGVAMGVDRLCMLAMQTKRLAEVLSFDDNNA